MDEMNHYRGASPHPGLKDSCSDLNYETRYTYFKSAPIIDLYFDKIFRFCRDNGIFLIFDFMPFNESSFKKMNPVFAKDYRAYIRSYAEQYLEFDISDTLYCYPDVLFGDDSHLNSKGKETYTDYLLKTYFNKRDSAQY
jgi:hypothetical protein